MNRIKYLLLLLPLSGCLSPFMEAAGKGDREAVRTMLDAGAKVNKTHTGGWTALMGAAFHGRDEVVKLLLERGADPNIEASNATWGRTALEIAQKQGHSRTAELLVAGGARGAIVSLAAPRAVEPATGKQMGKSSTIAPVEKMPAPPPPAKTAAGGAPRVESQPASRVSDVDVPSYKLAPRPSDYALIIGIENYSKLPAASFAEKDADAVRKHLEALGLPPRNIIHLKGQAATRGILQGYLEEWLPKNVKPGSTLFFYYSGHGAPDPKSGESFLVPWDADAMFLQSSAYPLKKLYASLAKLQAKQVFIALDSCFSGAGGRSVLPEGARPLVTKVDEGVVPQGNITLFAAASGDEITGSLSEQGHGMFTYYFLKGLSGAAKDSSGAVTAKSLYDYLKPNVQDEASRQNREQTPKLVGAQERVIAEF